MLSQAAELFVSYVQKPDIFKEHQESMYVPNSTC